ncbi:hypothetical protein CC79DRAFT_1346479 [Sarocladium strictum]
MQSPDESNEGQSTLSFMPVNEPRSPPHSKKRRAPHSCDRCRKRKVRCEPGLGDGMVCRRCAEESAQCDYTLRRTHRGSIANKQGKRNSKSVGSVARPGTSSDPGTPKNDDSLPMLLIESPQATPSTERPTITPSQPGQNGHEKSTDRPYASDLTQRLISSRLNNEADALDLLTFAASGEPRHTNPDSANGGHQDHFSQNGLAMGQVSSESRSRLSYEEECRWRKYPLIKRGAISTPELIEFIDFFFQNLWPLRPMIPSFYARRSSYILLVTEEPVLVTAILTISSRYHSLSGMHGEIRSERIHWHAWRVLQQNLQSSLWGALHTRSLGTITAMLLLTEWHSKAINYSGSFAGTNEDNEDVYNEPMPAQQSPGTTGVSVTHLTSKQRHGMMGLLESLNIVTPAYRSNKMSWMLLSSATALAYEACCFDVESDSAPNSSSHGGSTGGPSSTRQASSATESEVTAANREWNNILCVFIYLTDEHLASRLGLRPMLSAGAREVVQKRCFKVFAHSVLQGEIWQSFVELIDEMRHIRSRLTYLKAPDHPPLQTPSLVEELEYAKWRLDRWERLHLPVKSTSTLGTCLVIEFKLALICCFSGPGSGPGNEPELSAYRKAAIQACLDVLELVTKVLVPEQMRILPVRYWLYITSSALHLLQATVRENLPPEQAEANLNLIKKTVQALRQGSPDDTHMAMRFATFLEVVLNAVLLSSTGPGHAEGPAAADENTAQQMPTFSMDVEMLPGAPVEFDFHGFTFDDNPLADPLAWWSTIGIESTFP